MFFFITIITLIVIGIIAFMQQAQFGSTPKRKRLKEIKRSPNYKKGAFQNLSHTPNLTEGVSYYKVIKEFFFEKKNRIAPTEEIPSCKTDLINLPIHQDVLVWFGHSSYFIQVDKKRILVDPVFSGSASPLFFGTKAFKGTDVYTTDEIPEIDYLFISHDHWDHLDYTTIQKLKHKIKTVICGLGVGEHFEHWGYDPKQIIEKDWDEQIVLDNGFIVHTVPARHFSGRGLFRNKALWMSYVLKTPTMQLFIGGDSGYDTHFLKIGDAFGPFDLAILENGQYDEKWKYIHLTPDKILQAASDLRAKKLLPVHSSKFVLANHSWDEPLVSITQQAVNSAIPIITPMIGEQVNLKENDQQFSSWWKNVK